MAERDHLFRHPTGTDPDTDERFLFFWRTESPFSQWHESRFTHRDETFFTAEQWMMAGKARLFGDEEVRAKILATRDPRQQKALGRTVAVKIIKLNKRRRNIVVSRRAVLEEERDRMKATILKDLAKDQIREQVAQLGDVMVRVRQLDVLQVDQRRVVARQRDVQAGGDQMVFDRVEPLRALGGPGAHVVTAAIGMGEERCAHRSACLSSVMVWS